MFDQEISIYAHARDAVGQYVEDVVDVETGEMVRVPVKTMTIRDFCLTDRFKDKVTALRKMHADYGAEAKKMPEYDTLKRSLPAATLSGLFAYRRQADIVRHSGYIVLDMDYGDNKDNEDWLDWETMKEEYFRHYPEIAFVMRSCSGLGYFALVPIAYPEHHKAHARALMALYRQRGINLDVSCKDPTRLRFASWDDHPYINEHAEVYKDMDDNEVLAPVRKYHGPYKEYNEGDRLEYVETLISKLEARHIDITNSYEDWYKIGLSMKEFGDYGKQLFHRLSQINPAYKVAETERKWTQLGAVTTITSNYFIHHAKKALHII